MQKPTQTNEDKAFLSTIYRWLEEHGEVLIFWDEYSISPNLFKNRQQIQSRIEELNKYWMDTRPYLTIRSAFAIKEYDFPLRGIMDEAFAQAAMEMMPTENNRLDFLLMETGEEGYYTYGTAITSLSEFSYSQDDCMGKECVFGKYPKVSASPVPGIQVEADFPIILE